MQFTNMKFTGLCAATVLALASFGAYAVEESHMAEALKHAEAAVTAVDGKSIAEEAVTHLKAAQ